MLSSRTMYAQTRRYEQDVSADVGGRKRKRGVSGWTKMLDRTSSLVWANETRYNSQGINRPVDEVYLKYMLHMLPLKQRYLYESPID